MPFNKFFLIDSNNDEVSFVLELTSILQIRFNQTISLRIQTQRNIRELIDQFEWSAIPEVTDKEIESDETLIDLFSTGTSHSGGVIVSSANSVHGDHVFCIPEHLLKSERTSSEIRTSMAHVVARCISEQTFSRNKPSKKISLIHMDDIHEWISLIEASEALYAYWYRNRTVDTELELVAISPETLATSAKRLAMTSDYVVVMKITQMTSQFIKLLRTYNPKAKLGLHAFESPTVYFANTYLYGLEQYLYEEDLWLMSCDEDKKLSEYSWKKINAEVVPLRTPEIHLRTSKISSGKHLLYFGRISEQKNLHEALYAVSLIAGKMREEGRKFRIFGYEDFLGIPNLRIPSIGYLEYLYGLVKMLHLTDVVEFHQAVPVSKMNEELKNGIFFSLSVHSDENFGLVAFRALNLGVPVVLSEWGGHKDLGRFFDGTHLVPVYESQTGAKTNPSEVSKILLEVLDKNPVVEKKHIEAYSFREISPPERLLMSSDLKVEVQNRIQNSFPWAVRKWPLYGKVFKNYQDHNFLLTLRIYGAIQPENTKPEKTYLSPLISFSDKEIKITDCRVGVLRYSRSEDKRSIPLKQLGNINVITISLSEWKWLWKNGYALRGEI